MEVPGSIPGSRKITFLGHVGRAFLGLLHMLGHVGGHLGDTFWSGRGHFFVIFGMSWDVSGSGLGMFLDRFGMVLEKMSDEVEKSKFSDLSGSICPESGCSKQLFLAGARTKIPPKLKNQFY